MTSHTARQLALPPAESRWRALIATLLTFFLVASGTLVAMPAHAADGPAITVSPGADLDPAVQNVLTVSGTGYVGDAAVNGAYVVFGETSVWSGGAPLPAAGWVTLGWVMPSQIVDGAFTTTLTIPANTLDPSKSYHVGTSAAHALSATNRTLDAFAPVTVQQPRPVPNPVITVSPGADLDPAVQNVLTVSGTGYVGDAAVNGAYVVFGETSVWSGGAPLPAAGWVTLGWVMPSQIVDGAFTTTLTIPANTLDPSKSYHVGTSAAHALSATNRALDAFAPVTVQQPRPVPTVTVSKTTGLDPAGETVTVRGSGFLPDAPATDGTRPPLAGKFAGAYVSFGSFADVWQPSKGAASATRKGFDTKWGVLGADVAGIGGAARGAIEINADGTFETTLTVAEAAGALADGNWGIYTYPGGGATYAPFETYTPISFVHPTLTVSKTTGLDPAGETITVTGTGYSTAGLGIYGPTAGQPAGVYAQIGWLKDAWRPSEGAASSARTNAYSAWVQSTQTASPYLQWTVNEDGTADFTWTVTIDQATIDAKKLDGGILSVFTVGAGGVVQGINEQSVPISFATTAPTPTPTPTPAPAPTDPAPTDPVAGGSLRWAVSTSFVDYITGPIANGAIAVSGGATRANGLFQFGQSGSTYDSASGSGTVSYTGAIRFTGHAGALDVTIANPQLRITGDRTADLYVTSGGSQVRFATLDLSAAVRVTSDGAVTFSGAPATLTSEGRDRVLGGNTTTLSPASFTIGSAAPAPSGSTGTVASAPAPASAPALPATPPATTGIDADEPNLTALQSGGQATVAAGGFQPNETGIKVVVYSTPIVLGTVTADAAGNATWTGAVPATLEDGAHTLTFQGSVARGIEFQLARAKATTLGSCVIDGASLNWGFKESFRNYIEGIAKGGWELTGVTYEYPEYVWAGGSGTIDETSRTGLVSFGGSIRFTGHDGALDTTLANARIELAGDKGYIVVDVTGTTQEGAAVSQKDVRFAEFAVPDLELTADGLVLDALPTTLTDAGAAAFGTYAAGEALDPVSAVLPTGDGCGEPAAVASDDDASAAGVEEIAAEAPVAEAAPAWPWIVGGAGLFVVIAAVTVAVLVRRRQAADAGDAQA